MSYRIGIDAGSKTIKLVVVDEDGKLVRHVYWRHRSNIRQTLMRMLDEFSARWSSVEGAIAITGSAGISLAETLGLPFVQEVIATTQAVSQDHPEADVIVELGGEDAKIVYLGENPEQRMNATCAGGTGGFIDTIAFMLGVRASEMNQLARSATRTYPIASRCAVFAQTDVRPLLNAGARKQDIAASALEAVVRQTLGGLACGRPIRGTVVFLGGPFEYLPELARRFRMALGLDDRQGLRPANAHLFTARGTALAAGRIAEEARERGEAPSNVMSLTRLAALVAASSLDDDDLPRLPPLFDDERQRREFEERHARETMPRGSRFASDGPLYLGFDAGSTTVKYALVNESGQLVGSAYRPTDGDVLDTARTMLSELYKLLPADGPDCIAQAVAIGYGDELLKAALGLDADVVETAAHLRAARAFCPDVSFVLDIGGQDMKALWVRDGQVVDAILNEACSSGCGSFVESTAHSMRLGAKPFSDEALRAKAPLDLGTKCTVFMSSRVKHAQKIGATRPDIAAGIAYSVVQNALFRVIGRDKSADMGDVVVVQGGAFKSDAVLRAFEKVAGVDALRPDTAHIMGAIGAALIARDRARELGAAHAGAPVASNILGADELEALEPLYTNLRCDGCANTCELSVVDFGDGRFMATGNRCKRGEGIAKDKLERKRERERKAGSGRIDQLAAYAETRPGMTLLAVEDANCEYAQGMSNALHRTGHRAPHLSLAGSRDQEHLRQAASQLGALTAKDAAGAGGGRAKADDGKSNAPDAGHADFVPYLPAGMTLQGSAKASVPNVVAYEQKLLSRFASKQGATRAHMRIGLPATLGGYELLPFWHTLFAELGASVLVADEATATALRNASAESIPSESVCEPAKLTHARLYALREAGANMVLVPEYRRASRCAVFCGYASALLDSVPFLADGSVSLVSPQLSSLHPEFMRQSAGDLDALFCALQHASGRDSLSRDEFDAAFDSALSAQADFELSVRAQTRRALDLMESGDVPHGIVLAGRPYHMDLALLHGIDELLVQLGFAVLPALGFGERGDEPGFQHGNSCAFGGEGNRSSARNLAQSAGDEDESRKTAWKPARRLLRLADRVAQNPALDMVVLQSFGCGYDAVTLGDVRQRLIESGRPFTALKIDEIVDTAHIRIRLRTMAESIASGRASRARDAQENRARLDIREQAEDARPAAAQPNGGANDIDLLATGISRDDLATARAKAPADLCFTAAAIIARAMNALDQKPGAATLHVPRICQDCLVDALPHVLERAGEQVPGIAWRTRWDEPSPCLPASAEPSQCGQPSSSPAAAASAQRADSQPLKVGIVGNPLLCFDPFMNEDLCGLLRSLGAQPVMPNPDLLFTDDVRYLEQLDEFDRQGVRLVLYLQSFGCLKGHVQARGSLHQLATRHPRMTLTVLDYDPESSALNRENRVRLAVSAAAGARRENPSSSPA